MKNAFFIIVLVASNILALGQNIVNSITPDEELPGESLQVTITGLGTNFTGTESGLWAGIGQVSSTAFSLTDFTNISATEFTATANIPDTWAPGVYTVFVIQANPMVDGFEVICPGGPPGCIDPIACNYDALAGCTNGSCVYPGCNDPTACNYDPEAGCDDGSCEGMQGCLDMESCNYNPDATCNIGCTYSGCTDPEFCNYDPAAACDNGSCTDTPGCTDPGASNYNPFAGCDDGSCEFSGCTDAAACNYSPVYTVDDGHCIYGIGGVVFHDLNENGTKDNLEPGMENWQVIVQPGNICTYTSDGGVYYFELEPGDYTISIENFEDTWINTSPLSLSDTVDECEEVNFGFTPANEDYSFFNTQECCIFLPWIHCDDGFFPGVWFHNDGTAHLNGEITITFPTFFDAEALNNNYPPDIIGPGYATWNLDNYPPGQDDIFRIHILGPGLDYIGQFFDVSIDFTFYDFNGEDEFNSSILLQPEVVCAYDPNDKYSVPAGYTEEDHFVNPGDDLEFRIRFQNTGNFPAEDVFILDTLDTNLDWDSFEPNFASHNVYTTFDMDNGAIEFRFDDIYLPDSTNNEPESHGYVVYNVRPKDDLMPWVVIENTSYIFFDSNPAVVTNTTWHTIMDCAPITDYTLEADSICFGTDATITATSEYADSLQWTIDDTVLSTDSLLIFSPDDTGTQILTLEVFNPLCEEETSVEVEVLELPEANAGDDQEICDGETANLSASGGTEYEWDTLGSGADHEVSPDMTTDYVVTVTDDNGCSDEDDVTVTVNPLPTAEITEDGAELTASIGTDYQWYLNGDAIDGATDQTYTATENGNYSVEVTNEFGCSTLSDEVNVTVIGVGEIDATMILAYPNPASDVLYIQVEQGWVYDLKIYDSQGRLAAQRSQITNHIYQVDCGLLGSGRYTMTLEHEGQLVSKAIVIR